MPDDINDQVETTEDDEAQGALPAATPGNDPLHRANAEAARRRVENRELRKQLDQLTTGMTNIQQALADEQTRRADAEKKALEAEASAARLKLTTDAAAKFGLPARLAARLQGTTAEEIEADAKALAEELKVPPPGQGGRSPANPAWQGGITIDDVQRMTPQQVREYDKEHPGEIDKLLRKTAK